MITGQQRLELRKALFEILQDHREALGVSRDLDVKVSEMIIDLVESHFELVARKPKVNPSDTI